MEPRYDRLPPGPLTYEDYCELPDDGKRYEILDGELFVSLAPAPRHQTVLQNLHLILGRFVKDHKLGTIYIAPIDMLLAQTTVAQPDLLFIGSGHDAIVTGRAVEGPPDLAVEILSPSTERKDRTTKATLYARYGIRHYWIVHPTERTIELFELETESYRHVVTEKGDAVVRSPLFPGLEIRLAEVWD